MPTETTLPAEKKLREVRERLSDGYEHIAVTDGIARALHRAINDAHYLMTFVPISRIEVADAARPTPASATGEQDAPERVHELLQEVRDVLQLLLKEETCMEDRSERNVLWSYTILVLPEDMERARALLTKVARAALHPE